ncbi:hypothetical protein EN829_054955 [Mesorhizobium sp. M00.F.Ca.ET.186.01.1.1]|nr:hypothetical protein EN829_054955 [Mesorhizobium sp. M00.F.Ca.ET.186.01.1.1]
MKANISSLGGEMIDYESVDVRNSPFDSDSNGRNTIYKITHTKEGKEYIAWYRAIEKTIDIHSPSSKSLEERTIMK